VDFSLSEVPNQFYNPVCATLWSGCEIHLGDAKWILREIQSIDIDVFAVSMSDLLGLNYSKTLVYCIVNLGASSLMRIQNWLQCITIFQ
jgi:hypothetical protein